MSGAMTNHPLGNDIHAAYAAGALSAPMRLLLESHAELDEAARADVRTADVIGGALLDSAEPAVMAPDALNRALAAIDRIEAGRVLIDDEMMEMDDELIRLPRAVRERIMAMNKAPKWGFAGPGVKTMELMRDGTAKAELIRIEPGRGVPQHSHEGREFTLVLCGAFNDDRGRFGPGEMCQAGPDITHKPVAEDGEVCIALAVTDGPLAFTGPLGWVQRALRLN